MKTNLRGAAWVVCLVGMLVGCGDDSRPPLGGGGTTGPVGTLDGGAPAHEDAGADDEDAGPASADARNCVSVNPVDALNEDVPVEERESGITVPTDFSVTREVARWTGDCRDPQLLIKLSEGHCPDGSGQELVLTLSKNAFDDGQLNVGENILEAEPGETRVRARYTEPARFGSTKSASTWGTCASSTGQMAFPELPDFARATDLRGRFAFSLTSCSAKAADPVSINGRFNVRVPSFVDYCADSDAGAP